MNDKELCLKLSNGLDLYLPSKRMWKAARFLAREVIDKERYRQRGFEIRKSDTIVDIGSNMGLFVMWAAPQAPEALDTRSSRIPAT